ncbi:MAG: ATP-binding cassette domain-containing protein, partial [Boseongicola sp.]|nr:ATP-binding cassette domain-containing protein [Boseongicola sp.]
MSVIEFTNLSVTFDAPDGAVEAVKDVSFRIGRGECLGVVGESGAGKSQIFLAAMGLLASNGRTSGSIRFGGRELLDLTPREANRVRGAELAMIFQDPLTALTPHLTISQQMGEVLSTHRGITGAAAERTCLDWLERVRIAEARRRLRQYPH